MEVPSFFIMEILDFNRGSKNPYELLKTVRYKIEFSRNNPDYFYPAGIWCYCGPQGSGKTLSAVQCVLAMHKKYPKALIVSNIHLKHIPYIEFNSYEQLTTMSNGVEGIIFLLDELHVIWNSLESKDIPFSEMACFCQMRKDRRVIIGTSQVYSRIAKPIREQLQFVVDCKNYFNIIQNNTIIDPSEALEKDGHISGKIIGRQIWFHCSALYEEYDTLFKINRLTRKEKKNGKRY